MGDLLVLTKKSKEYYNAYILSSDEDIEDFFEAVNISSNETNAIIPKQSDYLDLGLEFCFEAFINDLIVEFPTTKELAKSARDCYNATFRLKSSVIKNSPDQILIKWLEAEYQLFKLIENKRYAEYINNLFSSVEQLVAVANTI